MRRIKEIFAVLFLLSSIIILCSCKRTDILHFERIEPTCCENGIKDYFYSKKQKKYYSDKNQKKEITNLDLWKQSDGLIKMLGHSFEKDLSGIDVECEKKEIIKCCRCNYTTEVIGIHSVIDIPQIEPTCHSEGITARKYCKKCEQFIVQGETIEKMKHRFNLHLEPQSNNLINNIFCSLCGDQYEFHSQKHYTEPISSNSRFLSLGFDDFRDADFAIILPLLEEYGFSSTFNRISYNNTLSESDINRITSILNSNCELGDHTWFHWNFIFEDPYMNGQEPGMEENQIEFPTNDHFRNVAYDNKNVFGYDVDGSVSLVIPNTFDKSWQNLSDEDCQYIRNFYSVYRQSELLSVLDELSNKYLCTTGSSFGSYDKKKGIYTGGIFSGCKTSANHEIWERLLIATQLFYIDNFGINLETWSFPGSMYKHFWFVKDELKYYDEQYSLIANYTAKITSSLYSSARSFNDCLRTCGYKLTHDTSYPGRSDGTNEKMSYYQLFYNAYLSRKDAILNSTDRVIDYNKIASSYNEDFFIGVEEYDYYKKMYEDQSVFYDFIESLRHSTANGLIQGEVIDTLDTFSTYIFFKALFEFCKKENIEVITHQEAFDICFNNKIIDGNLIHNQSLYNSSKDFFKDSKNVPENPDGYIGDCNVTVIDNINTLCTISGETTYVQYGVPYDDLKYSANVSGNGYINIYIIKNNTDKIMQSENMELIKSIQINTSDFQIFESNFNIPNNHLTDYEQINEGYGEKVMGIKIVYSESLLVNQISLSTIN